jgi:hypothetical protein
VATPDRRHLGYSLFFWRRPAEPVFFFGAAFFEAAFFGREPI